MAQCLESAQHQVKVEVNDFQGAADWEESVNVISVKLRTLNAVGAARR